MIVCRTLGPVHVEVDGAAAPAELLWKKNLALLIYLARSPKRIRTREHLIGLLWGDKPEKDARHSLNEAVRVLRRYGGDAVESDPAQVRVAPGAVALDVERLEALSAAGDYAAAAELATGEFLEGWSVAGASGFDDWLTAERTHWRRRSVEVLVRRAEQLVTSGEVAAASDLARTALACDAESELAARALMRGLALSGDRAGALEEYAALCTRLKQAVGTEPGTETRALAERIRRERTWRLPPVARDGGMQGSGSQRPPLVGRATELARLVEAWTTCRATRRATVAIIEGDAGAGKTRLAEELTIRARLDGAVVTAVRAVEADRTDAWSGALGIARGGLLDAPGVAAAAPAALAQLRGGAPLQAPGRALSDVLQAVADEQPVLVFVDDAHWLDRESLLGLAAAARDLAGSPLLCLVTAAPQPACPELDELRTRVGRELAGTAVKLGSLDEDGVRELARRALPSYNGEQLGRLTRRVLADSAGIPLLVVALLGAVAAGLDLRETPTAWPAPSRTLDHTLPGELPSNVVAAIRVNFHRLSGNARQVLTVAAVLGGRVGGSTLGQLAGVGGEALAGALDELEWQGWLTAESRGYGFVARIVRDVIDRDMVTPGQRLRLTHA